jgi:type I restriction enzyme S subunit
MVARGDVIYSCVRPYLLNVAVIEQDLDPAPIASTAFAVLAGSADLVPRYLWAVLRSPYFVRLVEDRMRGQAYPAINEGDFALLPVPLPPLAEQHRIVAQVDQLMALCDELEAAQTRREARRDALRTTSLRNLVAPDEPQANSVFFLRYSPRMITKPEHVASVRQAVLDLALQGRLVAQDPDNESAELLLSHPLSLPSSEHRRRKILRTAQGNESVGAALPAGWVSRTVHSLYELNAIVNYADGNHGSLYPRKEEFGDDGVTFVSAKDISRGRVAWDSCARLNERRASLLTKGWAKGGDVLLTHNATVGRVARVEPTVDPFLLGTSVTYYRLNPEVLVSDYFYVFLASPAWQRQLESIMAQTTRNQVSIQKQAEFHVLVPPLAEQHRIVAKVDELMTVCDELERSLASEETERIRLLEALLHDALVRAATPVSVKEDLVTARVEH